MCSNGEIAAAGNTSYPHTTVSFLSSYTEIPDYDISSTFKFSWNPCTSFSNSGDCKDVKVGKIAAMRLRGRKVTPHTYKYVGNR